MQLRNGVACALALAAVVCSANPLTAQITISPGNSANPTPPALPQNSTGYTASFSVQYFNATAGIDQKFRFRCVAVGNVTVAACPIDKFLTSGQAAIPVSVSFSTGAAGSGYVTMKVVPLTYVGDSVTGRRDYTVAALSASLAPSVSSVDRGVGAAATATFTLTNTGPLTTTYTLGLASGSCTGVVTSCSVSPGSVSLVENATQTVTVAYTASAAGTQPLTLQATAGGSTVASASTTINVLSAAMTPTSASLPVTTSGTAQPYGSFTLVNATNSPAMTVQLTASCTGVLSSCFFDNGATTKSIALGAGAAPAIPISFIAASAGTGTFTISAVSSTGVALGGSTLTVTAQSPPVAVVLEPPNPTASWTAGPTTRTYTNFSLTNDVGSPATSIQLDLTCAIINTCQFVVTGTSTMTVSLSVGQTLSFSVTYVAPTAGAGTMRVDARVPGGSVLATRTLNVTVQGPVSATLTPVNPTVTVTTSGTPQAYNNFVLANAPGSPASTFGLTITCAFVTTCRFSNGLLTISHSLPISGTQAVPITFLAASPGAGTVTVGVASGGTSLTSQTLTVNAQAPVVAMTLTPATASVAVTAGPGAQPYNGFLLTNSPGSPAATAALSFSECSGVTSCRFNNGLDTLSAALGPSGTLAVPISFVAGAPGPGTITVRAAYGGGTLATATLTVTAQATGAGMVVVTQGLTTDSLLYRDECVALSLGADIASECGDLRVVHALPAVRTLNVTRAPVMTYSSAHARAVTTVPADLSLPANVTLTSTVTASLKIGVAQYASGYWLSGDFTPGATRRVVLNVDNINNGTPSGVYPYVLDVTINSTAGTVTTQASGQFVVVNRAASPFGAGWWVSGLEQLDVGTPTRLLWYGGDGSVRVYNQRGGGGARVWGAASASYPDSIREGANGTFVRQLPDSVWVTFSPTGLHTTTRNAKGHVTAFNYDAQGRLSDIAVPSTARKWVFNYNTNGKLASITAPGDTTSRVVQWAVNATTGRVDSITDPGLPTRTIRFGYTAGHLMTSRTNGRDNVTRFQYDSSLHVSRASLIMPVDSLSRAITNWQSFGVSGTPAVDAALVRVALAGPRSGQLTTFRINAFGAPTRVISSVSATDSLVTSVFRANAAFPTLVTRSVSPTGYEVDAVYDARGRIQTQTSLATSGALATTSYTWDPKWDVVRVVKNPEGDSTTFGIDVITGNRLWQQDARGSTTQTSFTYDPVTNQPATLTLPSSPQQRFEYNALGNLARRFDEVGQRWSWHSDSIGRDTLALAPYSTISPLSAAYDTTWFGYSGRTELLIKRHAAGAISDTVRTTFDAEGNALTITRLWRPNPQLIAPQTTTVTYDHADRPVRKCESTGGCDSTVFDSASNAITAITRRAQVIAMAYDFVGRLTERSIPSDNSHVYPPVGTVKPAKGPESLPFAYSRPAEIQRYTYHASGQIESATALDADVARTYHPSGALLGETLGIRNRSRAAITNTYTMVYTYDRNGRRTARTVGPSSLFAGAPMRSFYSSWGAVDSVTDIASNRFAFGYNAKGELTSTTYPGNVQQTRTYDVLGRDSTDRIVRSGTTGWPYFSNTLLRDFTVTKRNGRGQIITAADASSLSGAVPSVSYDSVGRLLRSRLVQRGYQNIASATTSYVAGDTMTYDGLGNLLTVKNGWTLGSTTTSETSVHAYHPTTGRLTTRSTASATSQLEYDAAGNTRFETTTQPDATRSLERASYYGSDDRLLATDRRTSGQQLLEEYRYDALGRRVWVSTRWRCAPSTHVECIANAVTRTVWDGVSEVAEIRARYVTAAAATEALD